MKYYLVAGEASGDLHASNLIKEIKKQDPAAEFRCWGGDLMQAQGGTLVKHYRDLAFMGFVEVLMNVRTIFKNLDLCKKDILDYKPDAVILVDYPGFNLRMAKFVKEAGLKVIYYISPTIWAWNEKRVYKIKKYVDKMLVIIPFEQAFYKKFDYDANFVGHPLLDAIIGKTYEKVVATDKPIIAILPGSRKQEITKMLKVMLEMRKYFSAYEFVVAGAPSQAPEFYKKLIKDDSVKIVFNKTYELFSQSHAAIVKSGTSTLEAALFDVPHVMCYTVNQLSYEIAIRLVKIKWATLANLILNREVVKELIQRGFNVKNLKHETEKILNDEYRAKMRKDFAELKGMLGGPGASKRAAETVINFLKK